MGLKKTTIFIFLIGFLGGSPSSSFAGGPSADDEGPIFHVQQVDPNFDSQKFAGPGVKVHSAAELDKDEWKIPDAKVRDDIFKRADLSNELMAWDEMDKDVLFLTAHDSNTRVLQKRYPKLPKEKLLALSKLTKDPVK